MTTFDLPRIEGSCEGWTGVEEKQVDLGRLTAGWQRKAERRSKQQAVGMRNQSLLLCFGFV